MTIEEERKDWFVYVGDTNTIYRTNERHFNAVREINRKQKNGERLTAKDELFLRLSFEKMKIALVGVDELESRPLGKLDELLPSGVSLIMMSIDGGTVVEFLPEERWRTKDGIAYNDDYFAKHKNEYSNFIIIPVFGTENKVCVRAEVHHSQTGSVDAFVWSYGKLVLPWPREEEEK